MQSTDLIPLPQSETPVDQLDVLSLNEEYMQLNKDLLHANELERKQSAGTTLSAVELAFVKAIPAKMRRAIDVTRILRRTNTGPAKVKTAAKRSSKKAVEQATIDNLMKL